MPKKKSTEKEKHLDAFEHYFQQGEDRTAEAVAKYAKVNIQTVYAWRNKFDWDKRVEKRNIGIAKRVAKSADDEIVDTKLAYRKEISSQLDLVTSIINMIKDPLTGKVLPMIDNALDLTRVMAAWEKLVRLDLDMLGETSVENDAPIYSLVNALSSIVSGNQPDPEVAAKKEALKKNEDVGKELVKIPKKKKKAKKKKAKKG